MKVAKVLEELGKEAGGKIELVRLPLLQGGLGGRYEAERRGVESDAKHR